MKITLPKNQLTEDELPLILWQAHEIGAEVNSRGSMPCSICRAVYESGQDTIIRDHFHGSDLGQCKRMTYNIMVKGYRGSSSRPCFLADGHLHEHSMLSNLIAGLPIGWKIRQSKNTDEYEWNGIGLRIIGHTDGVLYRVDATNGEGFLIECKAVKSWNFKNIKDNQEISDTWYGQMQSYFIMLGIDTGYLIVKHRETSEILQPIRIDKDVNYLSKRVNALNDIKQRIINGQKQPDREHLHHSDSECKFCFMKEECWNGD